MRFGYKLSAEGFGPTELIRQAVRAEEAGFDFVEISDHYHPWLDVQGHAPFAWTVLGAIAAQTSTVGLATGVTCPTVRYHPAIIAQAAATLGIVSGNRFTLGIGSGERLNEHVVGQGFPSVRGRQERLREALDIINLLWQGGYRSYEGKHLQLEDARVFDLPDPLPVIAVAAGGRDAAELAARHGTGLFATEARPDLVEAYHQAGGRGPLYAEVPMAWATSEEAAVDAALKTAAWAVTGWKVMSELPNPVNFEAATSTVRPEDVAENVPTGNDPEPILETIKQWTDAGFSHVALMQAPPDQQPFFDLWEEELRPALSGN
jgi:G6PDH family F420-dependent oxidoreductase